MKLFGKIIEWKVVAMTAVSLVLGAVLAVLNTVQADNEMLAPLPGWLRPVVIAVLPAVVKAVVGYRTKHTPRPDLPATGGLITRGSLPPMTDAGQIRTAGPETTPAGQGNVRVVPPSAEPPSTP